MFLKKLAGFLVLVILIVGFVAVNYHLREGFDLGKVWRVNADEVSIKIRDEGNLVTGHKTIGIDEDQVKATGETPVLPFSLLSKWKYDPDLKPPCPEEIMAENGKRVKIVGFMYPLESGEKVKSFCLLRTTQTCCYGPRPQWSQYLFTEIDQPVPFERYSPVVVDGKFIVDPQPQDGYVYRLEANSVTTAQ